MTDTRFQALLKSASQNETTYFTLNQLYGTFCRKIPGRRTPFLMLGGVLLAIGFLVAAFVGAGGYLVVGFGVALLVIGLLITPDIPGPERFQSLVDKWRAANGNMDYLLEHPSLHSPPPTYREPDIYDYGVERLLIVERDLIVDLLVLNGQHAEQRMVVIAESGYPEYLLPMVQKLLEERPDLPVFLLHDATPAGVTMNTRISQQQRIPVDGHPIIDLGVFPEDFRRLDRTACYAPQNTARHLPVDAIMTTFLAAGMANAFERQVPLGQLIVEDARHVDGGSTSSSFG